MARLKCSLSSFRNGMGMYRDQNALVGDTEEMLEWFWGYCLESLNLDDHRCAEALGMDKSVCPRLFRGQYPNLGPIVERIRVLHAKMEGRPSTMIETPVTRRIFEALTYARNTGSMVIVRGETGRGKTYVAKEWAARNNHGRSVYLRCPSGCTRSKLVRAVAGSLGFGVTQPTRTLEAEIMQYFDGRKTLIVDEAGHLVPTSGKKAKDLLDFLRDLHDICQSGIVLVFTSVYWDELRRGPLAPFFEQFVGRVGYDLHIPEGKILPDEIRAIVHGHGFGDDCLSLATTIAKEDGKLRQLFRDLANASTLAKKDGQEPSLHYLKLAYRWRHSGGVWANEQEVA